MKPLTTLMALMATIHTILDCEACLGHETSIGYLKLVHIAYPNADQHGK